jgi:GNAT superfamily N-acetyltransferase
MNAIVTIERVTPTTCADAVPLVAQQLAEHEIPLSSESLRAALLGLVDGANRGAVLLARERGVAVGVADMSYVWSLEHGGHSAWLDELFVVPDRRGHGIGTALLQHALALAREAGCIGFDLEVARGHERADHLYARTGFHQLERQRWARKLGP